MIPKSFAAQVSDGQLHFQESLAEFEGQRVLVIVDEYPHSSTSKEVPTLRPSRQEPDASDVEQDVTFRMPFHWETVIGTIRDAGPLIPCIVVPEEPMSDE
jgi:hypothetical protein